MQKKGPVLQTFFQPKSPLNFSVHMFSVNKNKAEKLVPTKGFYP